MDLSKRFSHSSMNGQLACLNSLSCNIQSIKIFSLSKFQTKVPKNEGTNNAQEAAAYARDAICYEDHKNVYSGIIPFRQNFGDKKVSF